MDRFDELLGQIRDPRGCARVVGDASLEELAYIAQKAAAVLAALPAAHAELGSKDRGELPAVVEVVRLLGALETVVLDLANRNRSAHGNAARDAHHADSPGTARVPALGRLALL